MIGVFVTTRRRPNKSTTRAQPVGRKQATSTTKTPTWVNNRIKEMRATKPPKFKRNHFVTRIGDSVTRKERRELNKKHPRENIPKLPDKRKKKMKEKRV